MQDEKREDNHDNSLIDSEECGTKGEGPIGTPIGVSAFGNMLKQ